VFTGRRGRPVRLRDVLLGVAVLILGVTAGTALSTVPDGPAVDVTATTVFWTVAGSVISGTALAFRRTHADVAFLLALLVTWTAPMVAGPDGQSLVAFMASVALVATGYTVVAYRSRFSPGAALTLMAASNIGATLITVARDQATVTDGIGSTLTAVLASLLAVGLGTSLRTQRLVAEELAERNQEVTRLRAAENDFAVARERTRIAREMHDLVAHHVSAMVVTARVGARTARLPAAAEASLSTIAESGTEALDAMRRMIAVLRGSAGSTDLRPQPRLDEIPELIDRFRQAGLDIAFDAEPPPRELPAAVGLTAYRIVQEGLTNVLRHAATSRAWVRVGRRSGSLVVTVDDDGRGGGPPATPLSSATGRHGLIGMTERVSLVRGELRLYRSPRGGWRVEARLPLTASGAGGPPGQRDQCGGLGLVEGEVPSWPRVS
jgi:signal transduction histidine kinase